MGRGEGKGADSDNPLPGIICLLIMMMVWGWYLIIGAAHAMTTDYEFIPGKCVVHSASLVPDVSCGKNGCTYHLYQSYDVEILLGSGRPGDAQNIREKTRDLP